MTVFRHFTVFLCLAALMIGSFSVMAVASDLNGDGAVTTADARVLLLSLVGGKPLTDEQVQAADIDGDGVITTADARVLIVQTLQDPVVSTTRPLTSTTADITTTKLSTTFPLTTTTTGYDCVSTFTTTTLPTTTTTTWVLTGPEGTAPTTLPTTTDTTMPDCDTTFTTTYPTTMPYGSFAVTAESVTVLGDETVTIPIQISRDHALVGFEMEIYYYSGRLKLERVSDDGRNPYATDLNPAVFTDDAQWRFTKVRDGVLNIRYVSSADNGSLDSGTLFNLTFKAENPIFSERTAYIDCQMLTYLCCANNTEYIPYYNTVNGAVTVLPVTTLYPTTTTTVHPTTTATTLPYGDALCFTGETVTARVGDTFEWTIDVSARHSLVALELDICYDPDALTWIPDGTSLNGTIFDGNAQWRITNVYDGCIRLLYVSGADTGDYVGGELLTLTFRLNPDLDVSIDDTWIYLSPTSTLSAVNGYAYHANEGTVTDGHIKVASRSTRPKTTTTILTTTNTTWVLTGPDGTTSTTMPPTTVATTITPTTTTLVFDKSL